MMVDTFRRRQCDYNFFSADSQRSAKFFLMSVAAISQKLLWRKISRKKLNWMP